MKKGRPKTVYFRKDYYLPTYKSAAKKRPNSTTAKLTKSIKTTAKKVKNSSVQLAQKVSTRARSVAANRSRTHKTSAAKPSSFSWREVTLVSLISASAVIIAFTFILTSVFDPVKRSEQEISKLAEEYYIEYLYPRALGKYLDQPKIILRDYEKSGLPNVRLSQLLSYNNNAHAKSLEVFSNAYYECDVNATHIKYYPVEPYGPRDFTVTYDMACEKPGQVE